MSGRSFGTRNAAQTTRELSVRPTTRLLTRSRTAGAQATTIPRRIKAATIAFVQPNSITDSGNGFVTAGFLAYDEIEVRGTNLNNTRFIIQAGGVAVGALTLAPSVGGAGTVKTEAAGASVEIRRV
jgi:hypothetical protein